LKKPLQVDPAVWQRLRQLPKVQRIECLLSLCELEEAFGNPHAHSGLSIRKLTPKTFECRGNLDLRFVFRHEPGAPRITHLGSHDELRRLLRGGSLA
jgi:hypothetical protein